MLFGNLFENNDGLPHSNITVSNNQNMTNSHIDVARRKCEARDGKIHFESRVSVKIAVKA